jgi:CRP-like cAMP-binding protein
MRNPALVGLLIHQPLFRNVPEDTLRDWCGYVRERRLLRGEVLFQRGASAGDAFWLVAVGQIKLSFPTASGNERVLTTLHDRQCFGEAQALLGEPYPYSAEALTDSLLLRVDSSIYARLQTGMHPLASGLMTGMAARIHDLLHEIEQISVYSGIGRVINYLLKRCDAAGQVGGCGGCTVTLPMAKQLLASRLNLKPETLSRIFHDLACDGLIHVDGKRIVIHDVDRLRAVASSTCC